MNGRRDRRLRDRLPRVLRGVPLRRLRQAREEMTPSPPFPFFSDKAEPL